MESEVKRIYNYNDNPKIGNPTPIINIQQNIQQQVVPINIQQPYLQQNQPLYNQTNNPKWTTKYNSLQSSSSCNK